MTLLEQQIQQLRSEVALLDSSFGTFRSYVNRNLKMMYERLDVIENTMATKTDLYELEHSLKSFIKQVMGKTGV